MLTIETLTEINAKETAVLERECFGEDAWSERLFADEAIDKNKHYTLIYDDGRLVAYGGFAQVLDEGHIMNIAVARDCRGKGLGSLVLAQFFTKAVNLGIKSFTLEVRESNLPAKKLYEKAGFVSEGVRKGYYRNGENGCIYWRYL